MVEELGGWGQGRQRIQLWACWAEVHGGLQMEISSRLRAYKCEASDSGLGVY